MVSVVAFVGRSSLAAFAFRNLLARGVHIPLVVADGYYPRTTQSHTAFNVSTGDVEQPWYTRRLYAQNGEPVPLVGIHDSHALDMLRKVSPTHLLSLCFPQRIGAHFCDIASQDAINLHPSPLPRYRGPAPVFWQLQQGERTLGITVHQLQEQLDAGPVLWKGTVDCAAPASAQTLAKRCAQAGADAVYQCLYTASNRVITQNESQATFFAWPGAQDFFLDPDWSIEHAARFLAGTLHWQVRYTHPDHKDTLAVTALAPPTSVNTFMRRLRFKDGTIDVQLRSDDRVSNDGSTD